MPSGVGRGPPGLYHRGFFSLLFDFLYSSGERGRVGLGHSDSVWVTGSQELCPAGVGGSVPSLVSGSWTEKAISDCL